MANKLWSHKGMMIFGTRNEMPNKILPEAKSKKVGKLFGYPLESFKDLNGRTN
jgi:hypothetical protein